jgi:NAD(P)-dependent dehydrogenase (short-subunit alcohol dehydrogenase family)
VPQIPPQNQQPPGNETSLQPAADHGERSYVGHGRLGGKKAVITGADSGIRVNSVAPGPIWTPLIPSAMSPDQVEGFGEQTSVGRPGQPAELAPVFVMLASDEASYVTGARVAVTGGTPIL